MRPGDGGELAPAWLALGLALSNVLGPVTAGLMIDGAGLRAAFLAIGTLPLLAWDVHSFLVPVLGHERGFPAPVSGSILAPSASPLRPCGC